MGVASCLQHAMLLTDKLTVHHDKGLNTSDNTEHYKLNLNTFKSFLKEKKECNFMHNIGSFKLIILIRVKVKMLKKYPVPCCSGIIAHKKGSSINKEETLILA